MGKLFSKQSSEIDERERYYFFSSESELWHEYYIQTNDQSIGPQGTRLFPLSKSQIEKDRAFVKKWTLGRNKFYFPKCYKKHPDGCDV
jgi:hypothetical protein